MSSILYVPFTVKMLWCSEYVDVHDTLVLDDPAALYKVSGMSYVALVVVDMLVLLGIYTQTTYKI